MGTTLYEFLDKTGIAHLKDKLFGNKDISKIGDGTLTGAITQLDATVGDFLNKVYPVGAIYMSMNATDPGTLFGGTWERINDKFLLGVGDTYKKAGAYGGEATHTLTAAEMPSHSHTFSGSASTTGWQSHDHTHSGTTGNENANHTHSGTTGNSIVSYGADNAYGGGTPGFGAINSGYVWSDSGGRQRYGLPYSDHTHTFTTGGISANHQHGFTTGGASSNHYHSFTPSGTISSTGSGSAHNNMPPYYTVYMWKRNA